MTALSAFIARRERTYLWANVADVALTLLRNEMCIRDSRSTDRYDPKDPFGQNLRSAKGG